MKTNNFETRFISHSTGYECRAFEDENGKRRIEGYAVVFEQKSKLIWDFWNGEFYEKIARNALDNVLAQDNLDVIFTPNHDFSKVIARTTSGTLKLEKDEKGLKYIVEDIPNISYANDIYESIKRGDTFESSFTFAVRDDDQSWVEQPDGTMLRTIERISLLKEVSAVTEGAYANTDVAVRSCTNYVEKHKKDNPQSVKDLPKRNLKLLKLKK